MGSLDDDDDDPVSPVSASGDVFSQDELLEFREHARPPLQKGPSSPVAARGTLSRGDLMLERARRRAAAHDAAAGPSSPKPERPRSESALPSAWQSCQPLRPAPC